MVTEAFEASRRGSGWLLLMIERTTTAVGTVSLRLPAQETAPWTNDAELGSWGMLSPVGVGVMA
jgi:hypothetical protein